MSKLVIGGQELTNRLFIGTGKYPNKNMLTDVIKACENQVITMALRRVNLENPGDNILNYIPKDNILLPNTSGARTADEAIRIARIAQASGCGNWIKIEVMTDSKYLLPNNLETIKATEVLAREGFIVMPYMNPDLYDAKRLVDAGAASVMPLGAPIGSNKGIRTEEMIKILIDEIKIPIVVDAGIGKPSEAAHAMEMGADAVLVNTAIATAGNPVDMAKAFHYAVRAGRLAYEAKLGRVLEGGEASSPLTGFLG